jgi:glycosyltransferase involved in cell wall biosynthesis
MSDGGGPRVLLDCRWLGHGGAGRITEHLLRDLVAQPPDGAWLLWGEPARLEGLAFAGSTVVPWSGLPTRLFGQGDFLRVPAADVQVYLHQIRPLRGRRAVTMIYDTTPIEIARNPLVRAAKTLFFRLSARTSRVVLTLSEDARSSIAGRLGVARRRILLAGPPVDRDRSARLRARRDMAAREPRALFVGRFGEHKNLRRLATAFQATSLHAGGGTLLIVGGDPGEVAALTSWSEAAGLSGVEVRGHCSEEELDELLATSAVLVQPSLIEGYGLPAFEAAAIGLPVAASATGAMGGLPAASAVFLDPLDEGSIAAAIDEAAARRDAPPYAPADDLRSTVVAAVSAAMG